jgi:pimeloyl-ACP methyl ester carboxylesterase
VNPAASQRTISLHGVDLELLERGSGDPLLFLHGDSGLDPAAPFLDLLAERFRVIAPSHPGFGRSSRPDSFDSVDDLAYLYLDLIAELQLDNVTLIGASLGGWIAAELSVRCSHHIRRVVLIDPIGIKVGDKETRDIADVFTLSQAQIDALTYHDPSNAPRFDTAALTDDELAIIARNRESLALYIWEPYAYNPKLRQRLHRISAPVLLIWGESDRIVTPAYGEAFRDAIPGARMELIAKAAHVPHQEQPGAFAERVFSFAAAT